MYMYVGKKRKSGSRRNILNLEDWYQDKTVLRDQYFIAPL